MEDKSLSKIVFLLAFIAPLLTLTRCQLLSVSLTDVSHISTGGSRVFAAAGDTLYQYSFDLTQQQSKELTGGNIVGLTTTPDGEWIIACVTNGGCSVIRSTDLNIIANTDMNVYASDGGISLFTSPVSNGQSYYIGSYGQINGQGSSRMRFYQRGFNGSSVERDSVGLVENFNGRHFYGGFFLSNFVYFVVIDQVSPVQQLRIVRVCRDNTVQSQYELRLACSTGTFSNVVRGVSVINNETLIIGLTTNNPDKLCSFNISMINSMMDGAYDTCIYMGSGNTNVLWSPVTSCSDNNNIKDPATECNFNVDSGTPVAIAPSNSLSSTDIPLNDTVLNGLRATIVLAIDNINIVYAAFVDDSVYYLDKYHWSGGSVTLIEEVQIAATSVAEATIIASQNGENIFLTSDNKIVEIPVENCSRADSCEECVGLGDPLCGWCVFEGKCSRSSLCMDSESTGRYLSQGEESSCIDRVTIGPSEYVLDLEEMPYEILVTFVPALNAPKLLGEGLFCVFTNGMTVLMTELTVGGGCSVQVVLDKLKELSVISLSTEFAVFSNRTGVKFVTSEDPFVFYHCRSQDNNCAGCIGAETAGICGWCQLDFVCTGDNITCTEGLSNWLTISSDESYTDVCPLLVANNGDVTDYTQPLNVADDLSLITLNTPAITGLSYECVFGNKLTVPATRISDTNVMCDINSGQLQSNMNTETHDFTLRQLYNDEMYPLGTKEFVDINVVLYNCMGLAESCSQCLGQNINTGFNCNWCSSNGQCTVATQCGSSDRVTVSGECESPMITALDPTTGPPGGETTITIDGTNLGLMFSDIVSVMVGVRTCTSIENQYRSGVLIACTISGNNDNPVGTASVIVTVSTSSGNKEANSNLFVISVPMIVSVTPEFGPVSGGTTVTIRGENLDIGNKDDTRILFREISGNRRKRQTCPERECAINESTFNSTFLSCMSTEGDSSDCVMMVVVNINEDEYNNDAVSFLYTPDPVFQSVAPNDVIPAGGIKVTFTGTNLNVTQSPMLRINDPRFTANDGECSSVTGDTLECVFPALTLVSGTISDALNSLIGYTVIVDGANGPNSGVMAFHLQLRPDPVINEVINNQIDLPLTNDEVIRISGSNLIDSLRSDINITIGTFGCPVTTIDLSEITCMPPNITSAVDLFVIVRIGDNLQFGEESETWRVAFVSQSMSTSVAVLGGSIGGAVFVISVLFCIVLFVIIVKARNNAKKKDMRFIKLMTDMERMEVEMAVTCKTAFTELQTDLGELVTEDALESQQLPFQSFPTYATKIFFPHAGADHPVLSPPRLPHLVSNDDFKLLMDEFRAMVFDKSFLSAFIRTLETQTNLTLHEKSTIASLLMVTCLRDVEYATEILQLLLGDLIRHSLSQTRNHPKILLRRTESVAEKLLTNWFCVTLYPHLLETVGPPLFVLFKAVKAQLEKGPIDVISGEAKNSLSEEKLLRQALDCKVVECEVEMGNANYLLSNMRRRPQNLESSSISQDEIQTIKLLDSDSISQTKEKLLDFLYRNRPVSHRPSITEVELELCRGTAGIPLKDHDSTSKKDGDWARINTLGHYDIPLMAEAAIEDPKKPTPRFRLRLRSDRPISGHNFDVPGTIIASASVTSQTSLLLSAGNQSFDGGSNKIYHLVKPDTGEGESKIVSEVFLTRLLSTKRILQPYVDDLFHAIFTIPRDKPFPRAIKIFFDFLDIQAADLGITDPEVLHIWKTNGLPLRFWVNLIKNPEFIFDINKSATIDACFTIIAQAYIDACSTSEVKYTRDTPSARLLYVKEVQNYKNEVLSYYSGIQSLPRIDSEELKAYFKEALDPYFDEFEKHEGIHFHTESALLELYRYAIQYGDKISETLSEDHLTPIAAQFNSLRKKFNIDSSAM